MGGDGGSGKKGRRFGAGREKGRKVGARTGVYVVVIVFVVGDGLSSVELFVGHFFELDHCYGAL